MADAPRPITSPPAQGFQPWDAQEAGHGNMRDYAANGRDWEKTADAGACSWATGEINGDWPGDGTNTGAGAWKQT